MKNGIKCHIIIDNETPILGCLVKGKYLFCLVGYDSNTTLSVNLSRIWAVTSPPWLPAPWARSSITSVPGLSFTPTEQTFVPIQISDRVWVISDWVFLDFVSDYDKLVASVDLIMWTQKEPWGEVRLSMLLTPTRTAPRGEPPPPSPSCPPQFSSSPHSSYISWTREQML